MDTGFRNGTQAMLERHAADDRVPDPRGDDWAPMLGVLNEFRREDRLLEWYRDFASSIAGTTYEPIGTDAFYDRYRANTAVVLAGVKYRRPPDANDDDSELRTTGRARAAGGVELTDLVQVSLASQRAYARILVKICRAAGIPDERLIEALKYNDAWAAWALRALITGHQGAALAAATQVRRRHERAFRQLLAGGLTMVESTQAALECGLDPRGTYQVLRISMEGRSADRIRSALLDVGVAPSEVESLTVVHGDAALIVTKIPKRDDVPFSVGVSPPVGISALAEGFRLATRSAEAAQQLGRPGFRTLADLSIAAAVAVDHDVAQILRARYLEPFAESGAAGRGILETVVVYVEEGRNIAATAKRLYVHVNTVRYRVERFESITGCCLRDSRTITEVWWVLNTTFPHESRV